MALYELLLTILSSKFLLKDPLRSNRLEIFPMGGFAANKAYE